MTGRSAIAVVGLGKIARDQHLPALRADDRFALAATVDPDSGGIEGTTHLPGLEALIARGPTVDAVALCTPPQVPLCPGGSGDRGRPARAAREAARGDAG